MKALGITPERAEQDDAEGGTDGDREPDHAHACVVGRIGTGCAELLPDDDLPGDRDRIEHEGDEIDSWIAIWCAASGASPIRVTTTPARTNEAINDTVRMKMNLPSESKRRARAGRRPAFGETDPAQDRDDHRDSHARLCDDRAPRRALDPEIEAVDERELENQVDDVARDHDQQRRAQVGDATEEALAADREKGGRNPERRDPQVGDRVGRRRALCPEEIHYSAREQRHRERERAAEGE